MQFSCPFSMNTMALSVTPRQVSGGGCGVGLAFAASVAAKRAIPDADRTTFLVTYDWSNSTVHMGGPALGVLAGVKR